MKHIRKFLKKRIHASWHIAWLSGGILVGAILSPLTDATFTGNYWFVYASSLCIVVFSRRLAVMFVLSLSAGLLFGLWRGSLEYKALMDYQPFYNQTVMLSGMITEDTSYGPTGDQRLRIGKVSINQQALPGTAWVSTSSTLDLKRGDKVVLTGRLGEGFGNIPASMYRAEVTEAERPNPGDVGRRVRDWFGEGARNAIPEPQASLGLGFLTGQRSTLPELLSEQMRMVGLTHIIVASGYNLTILVNIARRLLARVSRYLATLSAGTMIVSFMFITGLSPSMSRAGLVSGLSLLAWYYGRVIHPLVLLPLAAALTVLWRPAYVWGDIGWYLSFAAFTGVILVAPLLHDYFWGNQKKPGVIREIVVGTFAAQLATLPIIIYAFGQYSAYSLLANMLILPLIPLAMLLTFFGSVAGLIASGLAPWVGAPATFVLQYMTVVVERIANLPDARSEIVFSFLALVISYVLLCVLILLLWLKTKHNFRSNDH